MLAFAVVSIVALAFMGIYKLWINKYVDSKALEQVPVVKPDFLAGLCHRAALPVAHETA